MTRLQRDVAEGRLVLPEVRPASVNERAWAVLVRHVRGRVSYAVLAAELRISDHTARQLAAQAAAALRYPDLADVLSTARRALLLGGYTTREAIARVSTATIRAGDRSGAGCAGGGLGARPLLCPPAPPLLRSAEGGRTSRRRGLGDGAGDQPTTPV